MLLHLQALIPVRYMYTRETCNLTTTDYKLTGGVESDSSQTA